MARAERPAVGCTGQNFFHLVEHLTAGHAHMDLLQPAGIGSKVGSRYLFHIILSALRQLRSVVHCIGCAAGGAARIADGQRNGIAHLDRVLGGEHIALDEARAAGGNGHDAVVLALPVELSAQCGLRHTGSQKIHSIQHTV